MKFILALAIFLILPFSFIISQIKKGNSTKRGWYFGADAGSNWHIAEGNFPTQTHLIFFSFKTNSGFISRLTAGYDFNPIIGVRGKVGYVRHNWPKIHEIPANQYQLISYNSENINVDLTCNLVNWWVGYNPHYFFDISGFVGMGVDHRDKASFSNDWIGMVGRIGFQGNFHIMPRIDLILSTEVNLVDDNYNEIAKSSPFEAFPALTLGLNFR